MAGITTSKRLRQLADRFRAECATRDVTLFDGQAEQILADKVDAIAAQLRITKRWALETHLD